MASDFDLSAAMARLAQMQVDVSEPIAGVTVIAKPYYPYFQSDFPYWHNRIVNMPPAYVFGQDIASYNFEVAARLVLGHLTEGFEGDILKVAYDYIPPILDYFEERPYLTNSAQTTPLDGIWNTTGEGAEITNLNGPAAFRNSGIGAIEVGIEFNILIPFIAKVY